MFSVTYRPNGKDLAPLHDKFADSAAFIAAYPEALEEDSDNINDTVAMLDEMASGETYRFWMQSGDVDVTRDGARSVSFIVDLCFNGHDVASDCLADEWHDISEALSAGMDATNPASVNYIAGVSSFFIRVCEVESVA